VRQLADALKLNDADRAALIGAAHRGDTTPPTRDVSPQGVRALEGEPDDEDQAVLLSSRCNARDRLA
jgi:hypothetical protein